MKKVVLTFSILVCLNFQPIVASDIIVNRITDASNQKVSLASEQFLDENFQPGKIYYKSESILMDSLNYHINTNRICFLNENGDPFTFVDLSNILMITYGNRTFVPISKSAIAEVIKTFPDGSKLLLQRITKIITSDKAGAYGGSTNTGSVKKLKSEQFSQVLFNESMQKLEVIEEVKYSVGNKIYITKNGKRHLIYNLRSFKKVYGNNWDEIHAYAVKNQLDIKNTQDLINLLEFCTK